MENMVNVRVRDLPKHVDHILNILASARGLPKWQIIREALTEYTENHKHEAFDGDSNAFRF